MNNPQRPTDAGCVERVAWPPSEAQLNEWLAQIVEVWWSRSSAEYIRAGKLSVNDIKAKYAIREILRAALSASGGDAAELAAADMRERCAELADERATMRIRLYEENKAEINAFKAVEAEEMATAIRALPLAKQEQS